MSLAVRTITAAGALDADCSMRVAPLTVRLISDSSGIDARSSLALPSACAEAPASDAADAAPTGEVHALNAAATTAPASKGSDAAARRGRRDVTQGINISCGFLVNVFVRSYRQG
jgi:hypothetical protein